MAVDQRGNNLSALKCKSISEIHQLNCGELFKRHSCYRSVYLPKESDIEKYARR